MSLEGRCHKCLHWGHSVNGEDIPTQYPGSFFRGERLRQPCMHPSVGGGCYDDDEHCEPESASSYMQIATGPMFGCVHFEQSIAQQLGPVVEGLLQSGESSALVTVTIPKHQLKPTGRSVQIG